MHSKSIKSDYTAAILKIEKSRLINVILCSVGIAAALALNLFTYSSTYKFSGLCLSLALAIFLAALLYKSLREKKAVIEIARRGVYACKLSKEQRSDIAKNQLRIGRQFNMFAFLVVVTVEAIILVIMYLALNSSVFLLFMAVFTLFCFGCAILSNLYLAVRLTEGNEYCTVSDNGIVVCGEVLRFSSAEGDARELIAFDDYYLLSYKRRAIFGVSYTSQIIFPTDGSLKNGLGKNADDALCEALGLTNIKSVASPFYEARSYFDEDVKRFKATAKSDIS